MSPKLLGPMLSEIPWAEEDSSIAIEIIINLF